MLILSIESSCDETAAALVKDGTQLICSTIASSKELHEETGGIVPEVAARKQLDFIMPVIKSVLDKAGVDPLKEVDAIAVTVGPGLIGSLIVGIEAAKALSLVWDKPLIPVNHLIGHIYANFLDFDSTFQQKDFFPAIALVVSGGHTDLVLLKDHYDFEYIGGTLDDAAGEAFDKTARILGISKYLGGAKLSKIASEAVSEKYKGILPRPMLDQDNFDFSFSGLKTAVKRLVETAANESEGKLSDETVGAIAKEFENAVVEVLVKKTIKAAKFYKVKSVLLGGGVSANAKLREDMAKQCDAIGAYFRIPPLELCTDNAIYIATAAYYLQQKYGLDRFTNVDYSKIQPEPSLDVMNIVLQAS